ncbi:SRPBCC family protein [Reichenbachiella agarivorans]|uniref:SRPBCC family protein n=1 Tax=Reichenbachiella agarivorans TaxID=2979464 RepID=A0ABY6CR59_9BACT|nr:SRPBCC family protein [Reichenbachiella agarivorans]UXP32982.1 SRPBCC family protein [Reichenbachiella agarivorans]
MIKIKSHSGIYTLTVHQKINTTLEEAWAFFSTPKNLTKITPAYMGFEITSDLVDSMRVGQIITYRVAVLLGIKSSWVTEITHVEKNHFFVDEQRFGPYSMWHHEHIFELNQGKVWMTDRVSYKMPFGILGHLLHALFVKRQLLDIFNHRYQTIEKYFR